MLSPVQLLKSALILVCCSRQSNRSDFSVCLMPPFKPKVYLQLSSITPFRCQASLKRHTSLKKWKISINERNYCELPGKRRHFPSVHTTAVTIYRSYLDIKDFSRLIHSGLAEGCSLSAEWNLALSYNKAEINQSFTIYIKQNNDKLQY